MGRLTDELHVDVDMLIISSILYEWSLANCCEGGRDRLVRLEVSLLQVSSLDLQQKVGGRVRVCLETGGFEGLCRVLLC